MRRLAVVCTVVVVVCGMVPLLRAETVTWADDARAFWLKAGAGIVFEGDPATTPQDVELVGNTLFGRTCLLKVVPGSNADFGGLSAVPDAGYDANVTLAGEQIVIAKFATGRYAKLLINAKGFDPNSTSPNTSGVQVTAVVSR